MFFKLEEIAKAEAQAHVGAVAEVIERHFVVNAGFNGEVVIEVEGVAHFDRNANGVELLRGRYCGIVVGTVHDVANLLTIFVLCNDLVHHGYGYGVIAAIAVVIGQACTKEDAVLAEMIAEASTDREIVTLVLVIELEVALNHPIVTDIVATFSANAEVDFSSLREGEAETCDIGVDILGALLKLSAGGENAKQRNGCEDVLFHNV